MTRVVCCLVFASIFGLLTISCTTGPTTSTAEEFYKGKTIRVISGYSGTTGLIGVAMITAQYLEKYVGAKVIVEEMPGAGGRLARNFLYTAKPDGLTIELSDHGPKLIADAMFKVEGVTYQWDKLVPLGNLVDGNVLIVLGKNRPWQKPGDLRGVQFNVGGSSPFWDGLFAEALGWDRMRFVPGYSSLDERAVAMGRGELDGAIGDAQMLAKYPNIVKPLAFIVKHKDYPETPTIADAVAPGREKWAAYAQTYLKAMYAAFAPPGTPEDRIKFLEAGLKKVYDDPGFREALKKMEMELAPSFITTEELKESFQKLASQVQGAEVEALRDVLLKKYVAK